MSTPNAAALAVEAKRIPLSLLLPGDNPRRKKPDAAYVGEMAESMKKFDVIEPLIVRAKGEKFQIVCGGTRYEAAVLASLVDVPAVVRNYSDDEVLEVQLIENIQRNSMHPIDEGEAFKRLIERKKHSPESLAKAIGKSVRWVYNRLEFTKLIPPLRDAFLKDEITVTHAELLARLEPVDQKRIDNDDNDGFPTGHGEPGLWRWDYLAFEDDKGKSQERKQRSARSSRDVNHWIESNVRLAVETTAVQHLIPEIDDAQVEAQATQARVLQVANAFILPQEPALKKRFEGVLTDRHWKRAGGKSACDHAERAVIVFGDGQGEVLDVCINKKQCAKHWPDHQPTAKAKRAGKAKASNDPYRKGTPAYEAREQREAADKAKQAQIQTRWKAFKPALERAVFSAAEKLKTVSGTLLRETLAAHRLPLNTKPAQLARALLIDAVREHFRHAWVTEEKKLVGWAKSLGVDVKKVEASIAVNDAAMKQDAVAAAKTSRRSWTAKRAAKRKAGKKR